MPSSLLTGVSGLMAHQRMLDVVANNLANLNTTAFKDGRVQFSDLLYNTLRPATSASSGRIGGTNPTQVGLGVQTAQITRNLTQGNLEQTGQMFDLAMQGEGMFVLNNGSTDYYSRAGSFALDSFGYLVDPSTGYRVQRFGTVGEPDESEAGFQTPSDMSIKIPFGTSIAPNPTTSVQISGNLNAKAIGPQTTQLISANALLTGGSPATATTLLNSLDGSVRAFVAGDQIVVNGTDAGGVQVSTAVAVGPTTTVGDLLSAINSVYSGATASLDSEGHLLLRANQTGDAILSLLMSSATTNTGDLDFEGYRMEVTTQGKGGDTFDTAVEVFDLQGSAHTLKLTLQKQGDSTWSLSSSINGGLGTVVDGRVDGILFPDGGSLAQVTGTGLGDASLQFRFAGQSTAQTISVSLPNLTQFSTASSVSCEQDGFAPGSLFSATVTSDGQLIGVATNGRRIALAQLAIASFPNVQGLETKGDNYYSESVNSGAVRIGPALSGDRGVVRGGQLEASNVDIAMEFTRLIVAQRGFSANARTITVSSQMLEELTNIIR